MKRYKVRHYRSRIYNPIRGKIIKASLITAAVLGLFIIGWFSYEPLMNLINDKNQEIIDQEKIPEKPQEPAFEPVEEEFLEKDAVAVTVPEEYLYNSMDFYGFLKSLDKSVTAIVMDMKTQSGTVTYLSEQVSVKNAGAVHEKAMNIDARIKTAKDMGFDVIARIYAFEDSSAPYNASDMAIRYGSSEGVLWLDDSVDNGGKPWLNPYSDTAQKYILDIVCDAVDSGVDAILLDGIRFPDESGMEYAYFGVGANEKSKKDILNEFSKRVYSATVITETDLIIGFESYDAITNSEVYGGDPLAIYGDGYSPVIDIDDFVGKRINSNFYFRRIPDDLSEIFGKIYESIGDISELKMLPVLDFEGFNKEETAVIFEYLKEKGATGYMIIYNEAYFKGIEEEPVTDSNDNTSVPEIPVQPEVTPSIPSATETPSSSSSSSSTSSSESSSEKSDDPPGITTYYPEDFE